MHYVDIDDCIASLFRIAINFDSAQKTPPYQSNTAGMENLRGALERVQSSYYESTYEKAAYLFVAINKGHYFDNGNKRLSLIVTLTFLYLNNINKHKPINRSSYVHWFAREFPEYTIETRHFRTVYAWATYNVGKAVAAEKSMTFDQLKVVVEKFIRFSFKSDAKE